MNKSDLIWLTRFAFPQFLLVLVAILGGMFATPGGYVLAAIQEVASQKEVSFAKEIRPLLQARCFGCHQGAKKSGDFLMTNFDSLLQGGESGAAAVSPGKPAESNLLHAITPVPSGSTSLPANAGPTHARSQAKLPRTQKTAADSISVAGTPSPTKSASVPSPTRFAAQSVEPVDFAIQPLRQIDPSV